MHKYRPLNRKAIIIIICIFLIGVTIMEILKIIENKKDPNIDKELLLIIVNDKVMHKNFGTFRGSNIQYLYNPSAGDTATFKARFNGSKSHINFEGQMAKINEKWKLVTYSTVSDSLLKLSE